MSTKYEQVYNGDWWTLEKVQYIQCCDCGLVHEVKVRLNDAGVLQVQMNRDNRKTGQVRRWLKKDREE